MKKPISWHKNCYKNAQYNLARLKAEQRKLQEDIKRAEESLVFYDSQIIRAEALGKIEFDSEKFGFKK